MARNSIPYIIHRTSIGCYERTLALLIEKYAGALPLWIAPEQARILPISEQPYLKLLAKVADRLRAAGLRVDIDSRDEKIGKKIREAQMDKIQYMLVLGDPGNRTGTVAVRSRREGDLGVMPVDALIARLQQEVATRYIAQ